jgi:hypothetical protein
MSLRRRIAKFEDGKGHVLAEALCPGRAFDIVADGGR